MTSAAPAKPPTHLCHYTNKAGYDAILASKTLRASTIAGVKNTHYGKGVYFASIYPEDMPALGTFAAIECIFGGVTAYAVERMSYYLELAVDAEWFVADAFDPERGPVRDIWLAPDWVDDEISIEGRVSRHGRTSVGNAVALMEEEATAARDYAALLKKEKPKEVVLFEDGKAVAVGYQSLKEDERAP